MEVDVLSEEDARAAPLFVEETVVHVLDCWRAHSGRPEGGEERLLGVVEAADRVSGELFLDVESVVGLFAHDDDGALALWESVRVVLIYIVVAEPRDICYRNVFVLDFPKATHFSPRFPRSLS